MTRAIPALLLAVAWAGTTLPASAPQPASAPLVVELHIDGEIEPVMAEYIAGGIDQANASGASLILIAIDTPGGLDTSMRAIIQHVIDSRAPVAAYVSPSGSRAASAGFFILLATDVAAMAPGTHTGAASPLLAIGGMPLQVDETIRKKILNDATAYLRSYTGRRGRNTALAETAVTEGKAFTETEALDGKLIDLVAGSREHLLSQLNGRTIARLDGSTMTLAIRNASVERIDMSSRQRFLSRIVQPDVFFILLIAGLLGLYTEFTHPGLFAPGVLGGIALVLALFAMHLVPVSLTGILLILLALALFVMEAKFPTHGVLGVGGLAAMLLGALMLVRSPLTGAGVSLGVATGATLPFAVLSIALMRLVLRSRRWPAQTGLEELIRETGEVTEAIDIGAPGMVRVHGELWRAVADRSIPAGAHIHVVRADGLMLHVERRE